MAFVTLNQIGLGVTSDTINITDNTSTDLLVLNDAHSDVTAQIAVGYLVPDDPANDVATGAGPVSTTFDFVNAANATIFVQMLRNGATTNGSAFATTVRALGNSGTNFTLVFTTAMTVTRTGSTVDVTGTGANQLFNSDGTAPTDNFAYEQTTSVLPFEVDGKGFRVLNTGTNGHHWIQEARTHHGTGRDNGQQVHLVTVGA